MHWDVLNEIVVLGTVGTILAAFSTLWALWLWRSVDREVSAIREIVLDQIAAPEISWVHHRNREFLRLFLQKELRDRWGLTTVRPSDRNLRIQGLAVGLGGHIDLAPEPSWEIDAHLAPSVDFIILDRSGVDSVGELVVTVESLSRKILSKRFILQVSASPTIVSKHSGSPETGLTLIGDEQARDVVRGMMSSADATPAAARSVPDPTTKSDALAEVYRAEIDVPKSVNQLKN
jgi:hypothetical protein